MKFSKRIKVDQESVKEEKKYTREFSLDQNPENGCTWYGNFIENFQKNIRKLPNFRISFSEETLENLDTRHELRFSSFLKILDTFEIPFPWMQLLEDAVPFTNILKFFIFEFNNET